MRRLRFDRFKLAWGASSALYLSFAGCDDGGSSGLKCGAGTEESGGECVVAGSGDGSGDGSTDGSADGASDGSSDTPLTCGEGTVEVEGECIVDPDSTIECAEGTVLQGDKCVLAPVEPQIEGLLVSHVAVFNRGKLVESGSKINQYYPVEVSVGLTYTGTAAKIPIVFALGEPPAEGVGAEEQDLGFCLVGGFDIDHPGGSEPTEAIQKGTMYIPKGCLGDGETERTVNPIILVDPDRTVGAEDQNAVTRRVAFVAANDQDPDIAACRLDAAEDAPKGTCGVSAKVDPSPGLDFELAELTAETAVVVLDKCADDWDTIVDGTANVDEDRPVSYRCNSSIVPDFKVDEDGKVVLDDDGAPIQATYDDGAGNQLPKWVYGAADLALDVTVITYGADDSVVDSADEATAAIGSMPTEADDDVVKNVLEENGLQIQYSLRPSDAAEDDPWLPLYLHKQGEQAKAGEEGESGQEPEQFEETEAVPATPHYYTHGLYVENDCGERNKDTCNTNLNPRTDVVYGDWGQKTNFTVRACLVPVDDTGAEDDSVDQDDSNNCKDVEVRIVRHDTGGSTTTAQSYGYNYQWGDGAGSQSTLRLGWGFHTWNNLNTAGLTVDNEGAITLGSDLIGYADILKGWAKGAAYVSVVGSFYDYGLSTFGIKLWGDAKEIPEYHGEWDFNVSKELGKSFIVWAGVVPVDVGIKFAGQAGVQVNLDIVAIDDPYNQNPGDGIGAYAPDEESETYLVGRTAGAKRIGLAQLSVTPYGKMTVTAWASVSAVVVRVGIAGELTLLDLRTPLTGRLWWGVTQLSPSVNVRIGAWADFKLALTVMAGRIYLFAENWSIRWCVTNVDFGWWDQDVWYPCGDEWNRFWDFTIASWSGWTWNQTLWTSPYVEANIP